MSKKHVILSALAAALLLVGSPAFAQQNVRTVDDSRFSLANQYDPARKTQAGVSVDDSNHSLAKQVQSQVAPSNQAPVPPPTPAPATNPAPQPTTNPVPPTAPAPTATQPQAAPATQAQPQAAPQVDPCSPVPNTAGGGSATAQAFGGYPYGEEEGGEEPQPQEQPKPANPVEKSCEGGKIQIVVGVPPTDLKGGKDSQRHFGHRIGDKIPVSILILTDPDVKIDFTSLAQGVLGFDGSDFILAEPPTVLARQTKDGKVLYRIDLKLQGFTAHYVQRAPVVFNLDLRYATEMAPDGKTPNWKRLTTPDFVITTSNTADNGDELIEGDLEAKPGPSPWLTVPLLVLGFFLVLLWPGLVLVKWINRIRPRRVIPANEQAWRIFDKAMAEAKANGYSERVYKLIASALRVYLGVEPATLAEVRERLKAHAQIATIDSALSKCDRAIYSRTALNDDENRQLVDEFTKLVPKPWDRK